jgi:hypothetical protein
VLVDPASQGDQKKVERMRERSHQRGLSEGRRSVMRVT